MMLIIATGCASTTNDSYLSGTGKKLASGDSSGDKALTNSPPKLSTSYMDAVQDENAPHVEINNDIAGSAVYGAIVSMVAVGVLAKEIDGNRSAEFRCKASGSMKTSFNSGLKYIRFNKCKSEQLAMDGIISYRRADNEMYKQYPISMDMTFGDLSSNGVRVVSDNSIISFSPVLGMAVAYNGIIAVTDKRHGFSTNGMLHVKTNAEIHISKAGRLSNGVFLVSDNPRSLNPRSSWVVQSEKDITLVTSPSGVESVFDMSDIKF